jgi:hypothetical protein
LLRRCQCLTLQSLAWQVRSLSRRSGNSRSHVHVHSKIAIKLNVCIFRAFLGVKRLAVTPHHCFGCSIGRKVDKTKEESFLSRRMARVDHSCLSTVNTCVDTIAYMDEVWKIVPFSWRFMHGCVLRRFGLWRLNFLDEQREPRR